MSSTLPSPPHTDCLLRGPGDSSLLPGKVVGKWTWLPVRIPDSSPCPSTHCTCLGSRIAMWELLMGEKSFGNWWAWD